MKRLIRKVAIEFEDYMLNKMRGISTDEKEEGMLRNRLFGPVTPDLNSGGVIGPDGNLYSAPDWEMENFPWPPTERDWWNQKDYDELHKSIPYLNYGHIGEDDAPGKPWKPYSERAREKELSNQKFLEYARKEYGIDFKNIDEYDKFIDEKYSGRGQDYDPADADTYRDMPEYDEEKE